MKPAEYWAKRAEGREAAAQSFSGKTAELIRRAYNKAVADMERDVRKIVKKYPDLANQPERARVARLEEARADIDRTVRKLGEYEHAATTKRYIDAMTDGYYRFLFDLQKGVKIGFSVAQIPEAAVKAALKDGWQGHNYSDSVWKNTGALAEKVGETVTAGLLRGASIGDMSAEIERMAADVKKAANLGKYCAERLIRTETNYFSNQGELLAYDEAGIEEYRFLATLDSRTSETCREHDGNVYPVSAASVGFNYPPLHVFCRSTTTAHFGAEALKGFKRRARDPATGKLYKVPADMAYKDWKEMFVRPGGGDPAKSVETANLLTSAPKSDIMNAVGGGGVKRVGTIDREKFAGVAGQIVTDEVVLTEERAAHIRERRGAGFLEKYEPLFAEIVENPDYIFRDDKPGTAIVAKQINAEGKHLNIVLRLAEGEESADIKNSIITAMPHTKRRFEQLMRQKEPVYKKA